MDALRLPTNAMAVELRCTDRQVLTGRVFVPLSSSYHTGAMRPEEWVNDTPAFLAFLPDGASATMLVNKDQVLVISIPAVAASVDEEQEELELPRRHVVAELPDVTIEGLLIIDMPGGHRRVIDHLNRPERFLTLRTAERWHLVNRRRIIRVVDIGEE